MTRPPAAPVAHSQTALALLQESLHTPRYSCACSAIDDLVSPAATSANPAAAVAFVAGAAGDSSATASTSTGLAQASVLELVGPPGSGKTRTALGYALHTRFNAIAASRDDDDDDDDDDEDDESTSSTGKEVLIVGKSVPTWYNFSSLEEASVASDVQAALDGLHYQRITDVSLLIALLYSLPAWLEEHPKVTLLILDSLTSHLRPTSLTPQTRTYILAQLHSLIHRLTLQHKLTIILTSALALKLFDPNGEPTTFGGSNKDAEALLIPQLGESWIPVNEGVQFYRIVLYFDLEGERLTKLLAAPGPTRRTKGEFTMDALGPCDHPTSTAFDDVASQNAQM
ncbi:BQ5605_C012g06769 [Microbotryum silenes-dioicae]|uniref:BQ5605_C012g06769 protein n=1 Tax=Microbotryum silenes-dioicae TaxID=796604 RepID=A0A2X0MLG2_9BASI|nr:BQ5605_C012g06769 [Microbotryum silenes-dioicae]